MKKDLFMKVAGISRYSLCFNADSNGIFRMHVPKLKKSMTSIGDLHWAFDFQGISVGEKTKADDVLFCHPSTKEEGQNSACNAVPDSGTTMMLGPRDQILKMFEQVCSEWERCKTYVKDNELEDKAQAFQKLVSECKDWMDDEEGLDEIPPIKLHLAGAEGKQQIFDLSPWSWVVKTSYPIYLFIQVVHFDIGSDPPRMSISNSPCTACKDQPSLLSESTPVHTQSASRVQRQMRHLTDFPRMPHWDFSQPL
mmetsp:Transcript_70774/g.117206  ORF Transcript_70774/g.117206 Transcript_70774/m.117206 type:complete len:252 (+) Transcript_70774:1-756(+)